MKDLIEILIRRKITNAMLFLGICFIGIISLKEIPVELLPDIEMPRLTVITNLPNAAPSEVEKLITIKIEESLTSVAGVTEINSESIEGTSIVKASFSWGRDMDMALIEAKEKVDLIRGQLPEDTGKSIVIKYDPSDEPVMILSVNSKTDIKKLRKKVEKEVVPYLERVDGIAAVDILGGEKREIKVEVDNDRLFSRGISLSEVCEGIEVSNYSYPAGSIVNGDLEYNVRTVGEFSHLSSMESVVVGYNESGTPIYLKNIADVSDSIKEKKAVVKFNGREGISLMLRKEPGKNTVEACSRVDQVLHEKFDKKGNSFSIIKIYDQSGYITNSINNVFIAAILSGVISFFVLLFFFRTLRPSLIILTSIPVSVTGTFILMHVFGITLNTMSLGGLAIGIGMMVDSGIVVLESIKSYENENIRDLIETVIVGTQAVISPVIASILTTIIVFVPIIFLKGLAGSLFKEMAMTVSFSLLFSLLSSVLLIPMLYTLFQKNNSHTAENDESPLFSRWENLYVSIMKDAMASPRKVVLLGAAGFLIGTVLIFPVKKEIMPAVSNGQFAIEVEMPGGTRLVDTENFVSKIEKYFSGTDEVEFYMCSR